MNNKTLFIVFLVLLAIYAVTKVFPGKQDRSFKTELIEVDTAAVSSIIIDPKGEIPEFTLTRSENGWIGSNGTLNVKVPAAKVQGILSTLSLIKTKQIAAKKEEKWKEFEVEESNGTRIQVYTNSKKEEDFIVGKFNFNPQTQSAISFVRLNGEVEIYAVDGFLTMTLGQDFNSYRDKTFLTLNPGVEITSFSYELPEGALTFSKASGQWMLNEEVALDSTKVANYLAGFQQLNGTTFADNFDDLRAQTLPTKTIRMQGNNLLEPIEIQCFVDTTQLEQPFVLHSNYSDAYFSSDSTGLYQTIFKDISDLQ